MIIDIITIGAFFLVLRWHDRWFVWFAVICGALTADIFSVLPFGATTGAFLLGVFVLRFANNFFDASSYIAGVLTFVFGIFTYVASLTVMHIFFQHVANRDLLIRGGLFFGREILLAVSIGLTILGMRFSARLFSYAFVDKKIMA
jgi:hypothetical protein